MKLSEIALDEGRARWMRFFRKRKERPSIVGGVEVEVGVIRGVWRLRGGIEWLKRSDLR